MLEGQPCWLSFAENICQTLQQTLSKRHAMIACILPVMLPECATLFSARLRVAGLDRAHRALCNFPCTLKAVTTMFREASRGCAKVDKG